jgi:hypothetical protein
MLACDRCGQKIEGQALKMYDMDICSNCNSEIKEFASAKNAKPMTPLQASKGVLGKLLDYSVKGVRLFWEAVKPDKKTTS